VNGLLPDFRATLRERAAQRTVRIHRPRDFDGAMKNQTIMQRNPST
jgi:hypothetical protein